MEETEYSKKYRENNKKKIAVTKKVYRKNNKEKFVVYRKNNKEKIASNTLKRKYGITLEDKRNIWEKQGKQCAICSEELIFGRECQVDHCHVTGQVRGILCRSCNRGLGFFYDNSVFLQSAINYIEQFKIPQKETLGKKMRKIREAKVLQILNIKDRGLSSANAIRILGYGRSTVEAVYSGNYEMIPFLLPEDLEEVFEEKTVITSQGLATLIDKQGYEFQDYDCSEYAESAEAACIRKEEAEHLYSVLNTLSVRDQGIIQAMADGQSDRQVIAEFNTSSGHIRKVQNNFRERLTK